MKITITKKEYEAAKSLGFKMIKELSKAEEITGIDEDSICTYDDLTKNLDSEKGKWGKMTVRKEESIGNNKIIIDLNEECISDIINEFYNPIVIATIKCAITVAKTFSSIFKKCDKSFDKVYFKWFATDFKTYVIENYINEDSPEGDFAKDLKCDKNFPRTRHYSKMHDYLKSCNCSYEVARIFDDLWEEYKMSYI